MVSHSRRIDRVDQFYVRHMAASLERLAASGRSLYGAYQGMWECVVRRPASSPAVPDAYRVVNVRTRDSDFDLECLTGHLPDELDGSLYLSQCMGMPDAYYAGDPNIVRIRFQGGRANMRSRRLWTPSVFARKCLEHTSYRFRSWGIMHWSFALGMQLYPEGMVLLGDGRLAVTGDICRPYVIDPDTLRAETPIGRADEWMSFVPDAILRKTGRLFPIVNTSQGPFCDRETGELLTLDFRMADADPAHPVRLRRWRGHGDLESWLVEDQRGDPIEIRQNVHDVVCTRNHILLCDTAIALGNGIFFPWADLPTPAPDSVIHVIDRRDLVPGKQSVRARRLTVPRPAIHLFADYEDSGGRVRLYMLHPAAINPIDVIRPRDLDLHGRPFPAHLIGYGPPPPLDMGAFGRHILDVDRGSVLESTYVEDPEHTWYPYTFSYSRRHQRHYAGQDVFVLFRGYHPDLVSRRALARYRDIDHRRIPLSKLIGKDALVRRPSICRICTQSMAIVDAYQFPERVHCHAHYCIDPTHEKGDGYVVAAVVTDAQDHARSSGHEYWIFRADRLSDGPCCRLGHADLDVTTVFNGAYLPEDRTTARDRGTVRYQVPIREDYPEELLQLWGEPVVRLFEETIYPYYERGDANSNEVRPPCS